MKQLTSLLLVPALCLGADGPAEYRFSGTATGDDGIRLYEEHHTVNGECRNGHFVPRTHGVDYVALDESLGRLNHTFARKQIDYSQSTWRPTVDFSQPNFDERLMIRNVNDRQARLRWQTPTGEQETFVVPLDRDTVIDAGFVHFIRDHWASLEQGQSVAFSFLAPTRGETYGFVAEPTTSDAVDAPMVINMRPTGVLLRWAVDPIILGFDDQGRLTDYVGLGNIRRDQDRNYNVQLRYPGGDIPCPLLPQAN
ncbi:hypothetical protein EZI54_10410 [Marinobacter halodurans]|uniref:Uncharacterized protein n=1 Tax=Marinobacter halodurans TaxID=2528979 RepID=A0ABY1ZKQ3_9GAMM|nr:hypothetical protein [Marinobacter halodurans]TBW56045.1 hypothetical protein EZI54_10410 [Marinobacter halodurans]